MSLRWKNGDAALNEGVRHFVRWRSGTITAQELAALDQWIDASPTHQAVWQELKDSWLEIEPLGRDLQPAPAAGRWSRWAIAASIAPAFLSGAALLAGGWWLRSEAPQPQSTAVTLQTSPGRRSKILLADGSILTLDAASKAIVDFSPERRAITLEHGRVLAEVAKDARRPFVITADGETITALGTVFMVDTGHAEMSVGLVRGRVKVAPAEQEGQSGTVRAIELTPGDMLSVPQNGRWAVARVDPSNMTSWTNGTLMFDDTPLEEVAEQMNRYARRPIIIGDAATAQRRLSAVVRAGDVETIVTGVRELGLANIRQYKDGRVEFYSPPIFAGQQRSTRRPQENDQSGL